MDRLNLNYFYWVTFVNGLLWFRSSFEKFSGGKFVDSLTPTLKKFASDNPYPWVKDFLNNIAIPSSTVFGTLVLWGELLVALSIMISSVCLILIKPNKIIYLLLGLGSLGGAFLSLVFWLAAGWISASTESLNLLMLSIELLGLVFALKKLVRD